MVFLISFPIYFSCLSFLFAVTPSIIPVKKFDRKFVNKPKYKTLTSSTWLSFIFQEELIQYQYNFLQLLNNLFKVGWKQKKADIIYYILIPLVYLL